jgi:hypothetical protein
MGALWYLTEIDRQVGELVSEGAGVSGPLAS